MRWTAAYEGGAQSCPAAPQGSASLAAAGRLRLSFLGRNTTPTRCRLPSQYRPFEAGGSTTRPTTVPKTQAELDRVAGMINDLQPVDPDTASSLARCVPTEVAVAAARTGGGAAPASPTGKPRSNRDVLWTRTAVHRRSLAGALPLQRHRLPARLACWKTAATFFGAISTGERTQGATCIR